MSFLVFRDPQYAAAAQHLGSSALSHLVVVLVLAPTSHRTRQWTPVDARPRPRPTQLPGPARPASASCRGQSTISTRTELGSSLQHAQSCVLPCTVVASTAVRPFARLCPCSLYAASPVRRIPGESSPSAVLYTSRSGTLYALRGWLHGHLELRVGLSISRASPSGVQPQEPFRTSAHCSCCGCRTSTGWTTVHVASSGCAPSCTAVTRAMGVTPSGAKIRWGRSRRAGTMRCPSSKSIDGGHTDKSHLGPASLAVQLPPYQRHV